MILNRTEKEAWNDNLCFVEGCEDCGNEFHIVGAYYHKEDAVKVAKKHLKNKGGHLHYNNVDFEEVELQSTIRRTKWKRKRFYWLQMQNQNL